MEGNGIYGLVRPAQLKGRQRVCDVVGCRRSWAVCSFAHYIIKTQTELSQTCSLNYTGIKQDMIITTIYKTTIFIFRVLKWHFQ